MGADGIESMRELAAAQRPPGPDEPQFLVTFVTPGALAVVVYDDGGVLVRTGLGLFDDAEDGLAVELRPGADPVPWMSRAARDGAVAELREWAADAETEERRAELERLIEHALRTPYYDDA